MDESRLILGAVGILIFGLAAWGIKAGRYPNRTEWVTRDAQPIAFWSVMGLSLFGGGAFVLTALLAK